MTKFDNVPYEGSIILSGDCYIVYALSKAHSDRPRLAMTLQIRMAPDSWRHSRSAAVFSISSWNQFLGILPEYEKTPLKV